MGTVIVDRGSTASVNQCAVSANSANSAAGTAITAGQYAVDVATSLPYATSTALSADLAHDVDVKAFVWADTDSTKNGLYYKVGASGAGSWTKSSYTPPIIDSSIVEKSLADNAVTPAKTSFIDPGGEASSYIYAFTDANSKVAFGIKRDGCIDVGFLNQIKLGAASGVTFGFTDANGKMAFGIAHDGNIIVKGVKIDLTKLALSIYVTPNNTIDCWGDSLTQSVDGDTISYPTALGTLFNGIRTVNNKGKSGQTSIQIAARMGAKAVLLTAANNKILYSSATNITVTENANLSSKANFGTINYTGTLFGIKGVLSVGWNSTTPDLAGTTTFTRTDGATSDTVIPPRTPFIIDKGDTVFNTVVIWAGINDILSGTSNDVILANIDLMLNYLKPVEKRFVILTIISPTYFPAGNDTYNQIIALNYELLKKYPENIIDIRKIIVNSYNPSNSADVTCYNNDTTPSTLTLDGLHLNDAGLAIVANNVYNFINLKGW